MICHCLDDAIGHKWASDACSTPTYVCSEGHYFDDLARIKTGEHYPYDHEFVCPDEYCGSRDYTTMTNVEGDVTMELIPVESSNIVAIGYDDRTADLHVQFVNGGLYTYHGVPYGVFEGMKKAPSKGSYHWTFIRNQYVFSKG